MGILCSLLSSRLVRRCDNKAGQAHKTSGEQDQAWSYSYMQTLSADWDSGPVLVNPSLNGAREISFHSPKQIENFVTCENKTILRGKRDTFTTFKKFEKVGGYMRT